MYGLPQNVDLSFFLDQELTQIAIGLHEVILNFSGSTSVTVQSSFLCSEKETESDPDQKLPYSAGELLPLIGTKITQANGDADGTLKLMFSNGKTLFIYEDSPHFECYVINHRGQSIIIV